MTTELQKTSPRQTTTESLFSDVVINTTSSRHGVDNVTAAFQAPEGCLVIPFSNIRPWDNPEDLVSHETYQHVMLFVNVYFISLCFVISVPTNVINMAIFWKHGIKERINLCLFCLSFADLIIVSFYFLMYAEMVYTTFTNTSSQDIWLQYIIKSMIYYVPGTFPYVSGFLSTLIAFERCLCVVSPLKAQTMIQTKTTAAIIAIGHVVILAGAYVIVARFTVVCMFDPFTGESINAPYPSDFYINNRVLADIISVTFYSISLPGIYIVGVSISTIVTIVKLRRMAEWREQSSSSAGLSRGGAAVLDTTLTRMLIGTSCVFVACTTPLFVFYIFLLFIPELTSNGKYHNTYRLLTVLYQMLVYSNSSVNFFVYYFFGTKFRLTVQGMFCRRLKTGHRSGNTAGTEVSNDTMVSLANQ